MNRDLQARIIEAQNGDKNVLNDLVKENSGLIYSIARRFINRGYDLEELYQVGAIGLIKAIKKFDFNYNVMLSTFAVTYIIGEIKRFIRDDGPVKISRQIKELSVRIRNEEKIRLMGQGKPGENGGKSGDLLIKIHIENDKKFKLNGIDIYTDLYITPWEAALGTKLNINSIDEDGMSLMDRLSSNENIEEKIINNMALRECIKSLNDREKKIIFLRYYKCQTQKKVADIIGISQVQVSRIENAIIKNLGKELREEV